MMVGVCSKLFGDKMQQETLFSDPEITSGYLLSKQTCWFEGGSVKGWSLAFAGFIQDSLKWERFVKQGI